VPANGCCQATHTVPEDDAFGPPRQGICDAVIVDEVQDLTCVALQMLHALVGHRPDGLLLVGDGAWLIPTP